MTITTFQDWLDFKLNATMKRRDRIYAATEKTRDRSDYYRDVENQIDGEYSMLLTVSRAYKRYKKKGIDAVLEAKEGST